MTAHRARPKALPIVAILLAFLLAVLFGRYLVLHGLSYREVIVALMALVGIVAVLAGERGVQVGFVLWVWTLGLGYRTIELTRYLRLHPSEVLLWGLLGLLIVQRGILRRERIEFRVPRWLRWFIPFWVWAWIPGWWVGRRWDLMFAEFKNFLLLIPLFVVTAAVLNDRTRWRSVLLAFYGTGTWVAGMGVLEYVFPDIGTLFPGFVGNPLPYQAADGFLRASFSFWGTSAATIVCVSAVPLAAIAWRWWSSPWQRLFILFALAIQVVGIYIGGYRTIWLLLGVEFLLWTLLRHGPILAGLTLIPTLVGYRVLPAAAQERVLSLILALEGRPVDGSGAKRWDRALAALDAALHRPWGLGWAGTGWTHSGFVQVAANLGLLAGLLLSVAYLMTLWRMWQRVRRYPSDDERGTLGLALFLSFVAAGGNLGLNGVQVLPQLVLPVWFVWVLAEVWIQQQHSSQAVEEEKQ